MQRWLVVLLTLSVAGIANAQGPGGAPGQGGGPGVEDGPRGQPMRPMNITKEQFLKHEKQMAERRGEAFDQAAAEARFNDLDTNQDGVLTGNELPRGPRGPITKEQFVEHQRQRAERRGETFDQAVAEAEFAELDKNQDGVLTGDERRAGRRNRPRGSGADQEEPEGAPDDGSGQDG